MCFRTCRKARPLQNSSSEGFCDGQHALAILGSGLIFPGHTSQNKWRQEFSAES